MSRTEFPAQPLIDEEISLSDLLMPLRAVWRWLILVPIAAGALGYGASFLVTPTFTAKASFLAPQSQGAAAAALSSLGNLASLAGGGIKTPADQYVTLMESTTVADRVIDRFDLLKVYDVRLRMDARRELDKNSRFGVGKKDGLITVEVDDSNPKRAADMANQFIEELRTLTGRLALSEARQRRVFFEGLMSKARDDLLKAQAALQGSGFNQGAVRAEPRAAAEIYGRLKAEVSAAEVKLATLQRSLTDDAPEVQRQKVQLEALRAQLSRVEHADSSAAQSDYLVRYREFKYQETLFDLFARQYEAARVDEAREGYLIQVVDTAAPPERKTRPKRSLFAGLSAMSGLILFSVAVLARPRLTGSRHPTAS